MSTTPERSDKRSELSPEDRASQFSKAWLGYNHPDRDRMTNALTFLIREVIGDDRMTRTADDLYKLSYESGRKAGVKEAEFRLCKTGTRNELESAYEAGRRAGFEEAAKVAETAISDGWENRDKCYACDCHGEVPQEYYPAKIRALSNERSEYREPGEPKEKEKRG